jgi:hypothetical protein
LIESTYLASSCAARATFSFHSKTRGGIYHLPSMARPIHTVLLPRFHHYRNMHNLHAPLSSFQKAKGASAIAAQTSQRPSAALVGHSQSQPPIHARTPTTIRSDRSPRRGTDFSGGFLVPREPAERAVGRSARLVGWLHETGGQSCCASAGLSPHGHTATPPPRKTTPLTPPTSLDKPQRRDNERIEGRVTALAARSGRRAGFSAWQASVSAVSGALGCACVRVLACATGQLLGGAPAHGHVASGAFVRSRGEGLARAWSGMGFLVGGTGTAIDGRAAGRTRVVAVITPTD